MPEITIALYPDVGGTWFLNRMPGKSGLFIALTGVSVNAADMLYAGVANLYSSNAQKGAIIKELISMDWSGNADKDGAAINKLFGEDCPLESALKAHAAQINTLCEGDSLSAIVSRITGLNTDDEWLQKAQATLAGGSPIAANTIWQQHLKGTTQSLAEVFQYELMLSTNVVRHPEFAEGVRALLIDKDRNPKWQYASVDDVPASLMEQFQTPPWPTNPLANLG